MLKYQAIILCFCLMMVVSSSSKTDERLRSLLSKYFERRNERLYKNDNSGMNSLKIQAPVMDERGMVKRSGSEITLSQTWKDDIVALHNTARSGVSPSPVNALPTLTWDNNLATIAREWALQCIYGHNSERSANQNEYVGENIALRNKGVTNYNALKGGVNRWINEKKDYDYSSNTCQAKACGHYTQVIWDDTTTVGCAMALCPTVTNANGYVDARLLVCNYSPGGNMAKGVPRPYQAASQC